MTPPPWRFFVIPDLAEWRQQQKMNRLLDLVRPFLPGGVGSIRPVLPVLPMDIRPEAVRLFCDVTEHSRRRAGYADLRPGDREVIEREAGLR